MMLNVMFRLISRQLLTNRAANCTLRRLIKSNVKDTQPSALQILKTNLNLTEPQIQTHRELLKENPTELKCKLKLLSDKLIKLDVDSLPILKLSRVDLTIVLYKYAYAMPNLVRRLRYLETELQVDAYKLVGYLNGHTIVLIMDSERLQTIMKLLKLACVNSESILNDMYVLRHNVQLMESRINQAQMHKAPVKTWMLRCSQSVFDNSINRWCNKSRVLGESDQIDYLSKRLACNPDEILTLTKKNNRILTIYPGKLEEILDFLFSEGFTPQQVCQSPQVLSHKLSTIRERHKDYKDIGCFPSTLLPYCYSQFRHQKRLQHFKNVFAAKRN